MHCFFIVFSSYIIKSKISFAKAMITPPKKVRNPFALCDASWDFSDKPICTTPKPSRINPMALMAEKIKSDKLLMVDNGSAANTLFVVHDRTTAIVSSTIFVFLRMADAFSILLFLFIV